MRCPDRACDHKAMCLLVVLLLATIVAPASGQFSPPRKVATGRTGFSAERLARIDRAIQQRVDDGSIAGAVGYVLRDGAVVYERAFGWSDKEAGRRMSVDAIFRIASQSKAVTTTAVLMLMEEGKLSVGDPVSRYIPTFSRTTVSITADSIVPARRQITIFDLLTHSAGISYGTDAKVSARYQAAGLGPAAGYGWYTADKDESICATMERLGTLPFVAHPGAAFVYGYNTDILGCVVEKVSGVPLDEFVRTRITEPLGMRDTHFFLPRDKASRLTAVYATGSDGRAVRAPDGAKGQGHYLDGPRRSFAGGAGLLSTARDYGRFLQMLLNGGTLDGTRLLSPKTVDVMSTDQLGSIYGSTGMGFGLGFSIAQRTGADGLASAGTYGWGGAYATVYKIDPRERLVIVFMIQMLPNGSDIREKFPTLVYQALTEPRR